MRRIRLSRAPEEGFTLVEVVVALLVFALVGSAAAAGAIAGLKAQSAGDRYRQATGTAEQAIEVARAAGFAGLVMSASQLGAAGDPAILTSCSGVSGTYFYLPSGLSQCELIPTVTSGTTVPLHPTAPSSVFTIAQYVTFAAGTNQLVKRISEIVTWTDHGVAKSFQTSSMVSAFTKAPLPARGVDISSSSGVATATAGYVAVFRAIVSNIGTADDTFNLTASLPNGVSWSTLFYRDANGDGSPDAYGAPTAPQLTDANGDGVVDTGRVTSGGSTPVLLAISVPAGATAGSYPVTLTATSTSDSTVSKSVNLTLVAVSTATSMALYLHNSVTQPLPNSSTTAQLNMPMDTTVPTATFTASQEPNLASDVKGGGMHGRYVTATVANPGQQSSTYMADWVYGTLAGHLQVSGPITVVVNAAACGTGSVPASASIVAYLGVTATGVDSPSTSWLTDNSATPVSTPVSTDCTGKFAAPITLTLPAPAGGVVFSGKSVLELKVVVTSAGGSSFISYDSTGLESQLVLPVVAT